MRAITKFAAAATVALTMGAVSAADAAVYIGLQQAGVNGGAIFTAATGPTAAVYVGAYGTFEFELITGVDGIFPSLLASTTSDHNVLSTTGGVLDIYVTRDNIAGPVPQGFRSVFTTNNLPAGWSVTQTTYYSAANAVYTGAQLATTTFTSGPDTDVFTSLVAPGAGPYSLTSRYTLTADVGGSVENTISIHAAVPEPGTWALMIIGFGGAGAMLRSRRRQAALTA